MPTSIVAATPPLLIKSACLGFIQRGPSSVEIRSQLTYYYTARIPVIRHKIQVAMSSYSPSLTVHWLVCCSVTNLGSDELNTIPSLHST
ncbi:hypothetical protein CONPUDRAFT_141419 [Coniophora puteana RWD-64-598 SS2]|uniref:Uncharacterized protein n=1 Tax=Coniophora puteana (strain RWD-64-598) TaxID=741705 RepID=A0A5M3N7D6_CONPW|nr:uncharacterized protein CONPUDRAFT_141419 [Coniophora puteana RWD-64-598 SS2]EIW87198.1 hypothetical protein CONPUDRAFT_141419 [Coniophora puteana RWD-64-598 SS2]